MLLVTRDKKEILGRANPRRAGPCADFGLTWKLIGSKLLPAKDAPPSTERPVKKKNLV